MGVVLAVAKAEAGLRTPLMQFSACMTKLPSAHITISIPVSVFAIEVAMFGMFDVDIATEDWLGKPNREFLDMELAYIHG